MSSTTMRPKVDLRLSIAEGRAITDPHKWNFAELSDEALIASGSHGDVEAFGLLFRRYATHIHNVGKQILRNHSEADDLVQEVFLYLHRKSYLFDPARGDARSWIFQVAYTQAYLRRRRLVSIGFYVPQNAGDAPLFDASVTVQPEYDRSLEGLFGRSAWRKIIEELTEDQRETLRLHFFEGLTFAEIAEKLGQSHHNIRHHHYRGLEKLRKYIARSKLNVL